MEDKEEKTKIKLTRVLPYLIGAVIGLAIVIVYIISNNNGTQTTEEPSSGMELLALVLLVVSMFVGFALHIILHEAGHLICGVISGYKFVTFTIGSIMFIKEDGKLRIKKFSIAGLGGQCLMSPPEPVDDVYPFVLYNLGGGLMNFLISAVTISLYIALIDAFSFAGVVFLPFTGIGVLLGLTNLLPIKMSGIAVDGRNIVTLKKSEEARRAFWLLLTVHVKIASGGRGKDLPEEWFEFSDDYDFNNSILGNLAATGVGRLIDCHDFADAKTLAERILAKGDKLVNLFKNEVRCELLFLEIISEPSQRRTDAITGLFTPKLKEYIKASKTHPSKRRVMYAYEKLVAFDNKESKRALEAFEKTCRKYPYSGDLESERELIEFIDNLASVNSVVEYNGTKYKYLGNGCEATGTGTK